MHNPRLHPLNGHSLQTTVHLTNTQQVNLTRSAAQQRRGLNLFRSAATRCYECHAAPTFGADDFFVTGVPDLDGQEHDAGRASVAEDGKDGAFKAPTLRNIALSAPYMHNLSIEVMTSSRDVLHIGRAQSDVPQSWCFERAILAILCNGGASRIMCLSIQVRYSCHEEIVRAKCGCGMTFKTTRRCRAEQVQAAALLCAERVKLTCRVFVKWTVVGNECPFKGCDRGLCIFHRDRISSTTEGIVEQRDVGGNRFQPGFDLFRGTRHLGRFEKRY